MLITFILGIIFGVSGLALLDCLTSLIISFLEYLKSWISIRIARNNQQIQRASNEPEIISSIGFKPTEEVEPEE